MRVALVQWAALLVLVRAGFKVAAMEPHVWGDAVLVALGWTLVAMFVIWALLALTLPLVAARKRSRP